MTPEEIDQLTTTTRLDEIQWLKEFLTKEKLFDPRDARKLAQYISGREKILGAIYEETKE